MVAMTARYRQTDKETRRKLRGRDGINDSERQTDKETRRKLRGWGGSNDSEIQTKKQGES